MLEPRHLLAVVINEIHYDPDLNTERVEFLELYNSGGAAVDLSGWRIDEAVDYLFPAGASIPADGYLVIAEDFAAFQAKFGFTPYGQWEVGDKLSNDGETIELRDASNTLVDVVSYRPGFPWPTTGEWGSSLELVNPGLDNDLAGSWRSSGLTSSPHAGQTLIHAGAPWRYRKGITANPPSEANTPSHDWRLTEFVEANDVVAWQLGNASIGYGDGDDATILGDMRYGYSTIYARRTFVLNSEIPDELLLRLYVDDGAIVYINGFELPRFHVTPGDKHYDSTSGFNNEAIWEELLLTDAAQYLVEGVNTVAVHVLNDTIESSDLSFNLELKISDDRVGQPTPGARNSVFAANAPPQLRQLNQSVEQPTSGEEVVISVKVTDPDGVQSVALQYQVVDPGAYVRLTDPAYQMGWSTVAMRDDGSNGDQVAGDAIYSVTLPSSIQTHRRLVRYRITATDTVGASIQAPYADDPQPNFAYFVYDGVPDYMASLRPGVQPNVVYSGEVLDRIATYHLLANSQDVQNSQYNSQFNEVLFRGTLVYDGVVYDHVEFRNRGVASTYAVGKNKWKIEFLHGHHLQARDNYGRPYNEPWDEINVLPGTNPWWRNDVSTDGTVLFEPAAFKLYELAGAPAPNTTYFNFRIIDSASETGANQYGGDFWGLYIGIEQPDGSFLDERGLPDGNIYNMHSSVWGATNQRHQGSQSVTDRSDLAAFLAGIDGGFETLAWWEANLNWDVYFAWNIVNHVVNNSDIRPNENVNYYHNLETGQWHVIPWDLDLTFEDAPHFGNPVTNRENIRTLLAHHPLARLAYENRFREITDLLLDSGDAARVIEELASILTLGVGDLSIVNANQAMWDYHPQKNKKGIWYENFNPALLSDESFTGLVEYMQNFVSPGGYGYNLAQGQGSDANIPATPTISYVGDPGHAVDQLVFATTPFSDPQGAGTFAQIEWRIAEVLNPSVANYTSNLPYIYEIEGSWQSGAQTTFADQIVVPANAATAGKTYRARVRMQDADGHWSHWSAPYEFLATPATSNPALIISEINYHPGDHPDVSDAEDLEFIEILNLGQETVDLSGMQITEFASNPYVFAEGLTLAPGERIVVARTPAVFEAAYGSEIYLAPTGYANANLSNGGETIALATAAGVEFFSFTYDDSAPWPTTPDGGGFSLEIIDPFGDPNSPTNWRASQQPGGTPGTPLAGDYDQNGSVDGRDFLAWQRQFGNPATPAGSDADGNYSGTVEGGDLQVWARNYSRSRSPVEILIASAIVTDSPAPRPIDVSSPSRPARGENMSHPVPSLIGADALLADVLFARPARTTRIPAYDSLDSPRPFASMAPQTAHSVLLGSLPAVDHFLTHTDARIRLAWLERHTADPSESEELSHIDQFFTRLADDL